MKSQLIKSYIFTGLLALLLGACGENYADFVREGVWGIAQSSSADREFSPFAASGDDYFGVKSSYIEDSESGEEIDSGDDESEESEEEEAKDAENEDSEDEISDVNDEPEASDIEEELDLLPQEANIVESYDKSKAIGIDWVKLAKIGAGVVISVTVAVVIAKMLAASKGADVGGGLPPELNKNNGGGGAPLGGGGAAVVKNDAALGGGGAAVVKNDAALGGVGGAAVVKNDAALGGVGDAAVVKNDGAAVVKKNAALGGGMKFNGPDLSGAAAAVKHLVGGGGAKLNGLNVNMPKLGGVAGGGVKKAVYTGVTGAISALDGAALTAYNAATNEYMVTNKVVVDASDYPGNVKLQEIANKNYAAAYEDYEW